MEQRYSVGRIQGIAKAFVCGSVSQFVTNAAAIQYNLRNINQSKQRRTFKTEFKQDLRVVPRLGMMMAIKHLCSKPYRFGVSRRPSYTFALNFVTGMLAGGIICTATYPIDVARWYLQQKTPLIPELPFPSSAFTYTRMIYTRHKLADGIYRKFIPTFLASVVHRGFWFALYEVQLTHSPILKNNIIGRLLAAALASFLAQAISQPFQTAQRHWLMDASHPDCVKLVRSLKRRHGYSFFWKDLFRTTAKSQMLNATLAMFFFTECLRLANRAHHMYLVG
eukprot:TRINITY_DN15097_c0_g1_i1.p1 TRINITY_DN15097_c0_g1~~TRINITY_DN15097_c0_g1_i1.p1  ORF type:complete len:279 (+),score=10.52 TRINITY_DN15097_c0_g1_i1:34-870(+)